MSGYVKQLTATVTRHSAARRHTALPADIRCNDCCVCNMPHAMNYAPSHQLSSISCLRSHDPHTHSLLECLTFSHDLFTCPDVEHEYAYCHRSYTAFGPLLSVRRCSPDSMGPCLHMAKQGVENHSQWKVRQDLYCFTSV